MDWFTIRSAFATRPIPPPVPVIVSVNDPIGTFVGSVTVSIEPKLGVAEGTLRTPLASGGSPETVNETCELKPLRATTLTV